MTARAVAIDFETYYATDYSLTDMPTAAYVHDRRFQIIGFSVQVDDNATLKFDGHHLKQGIEYLHNLKLDTPGTVVIAHNASFDGMILERRLRTRPWKYFCTAQAARAWVVPFTAKGRASLAETVAHLGLGVKGTEVIAAKGKRLEDFSAEDLAKYMDYCANDTRLSYIAYRLFMQRYTDADALSEVDLIDLTVKKAVRPQLVFDAEVLREGYKEAVDNRRDLINAAAPIVCAYVDKGLRVSAYEYTCTILGSDLQLANLLSRMGVPVPKKVSVRTGKFANAFSKTDPEFLAYLNPVDQSEKWLGVRSIVAARLALKSAQEENRFGRFMQVANSTPEGHVFIPLSYYGAHTGRFSGMDRLNFQNLGRKSRLREALKAPPGFVVLAGDESQIEARLTCCLAGQNDMLEQFRRGEDVYSSFATDVYGYPVSAETHPDERFVGKQGVLSLGFGVGALKFFTTLNNVYHHPITMEEALHVVDSYRTRYRHIVQLWSNLRPALQVMAAGGTMTIGPLRFERERMVLPNNMPIFYHKLHWDGSNYVYWRKGGWNRIYPAKLLENAIQALARVILTDAELLLARHGMRAAHSVHDELVYVVPEHAAEACAKALHKALTAKKSWMPNLPLDSKVKYGPTYAATK